jgi:trigger factor
VATQTVKPKVIKKDDITVKLSEHPGCNVIVTVNLPSDHSQKAHKDAVKRINKEVSLPGFRKGKAPESVILKHYQSYVDKEWKEILVHQALNKGLEIAEISPLNSRNINPPKTLLCDLAEGCEFEFSFEKEPSISELDIEGIKPKKAKAVKVTKAQAKEYIENLQLMDAEWTDVKDRGVKKGDFVELDIFSIDETPPRTICAQKRFHVAKNKMGQWLQDLIMEKKTGDEVEGKSELDDKANKDIAENFQPTNCKITIKSVKTAKLPKVDEDFAKKLGLPSTEELNEQVEKRLTQEEEGKAEEGVLKSIQDALIKKTKFDLPVSMLEEERNQRLKERLSQLKKENLSKEQILEKETEIEKEVKVDVERSLKLWFISKHLAQENNISVSEQEVTQAIVTQLSQFAGSGMDVKSFVQNDSVRSRIFVDLLMQKVNRFLLDKIKTA